ncbi:coiled-coil domain-containing protein 142 [Phaenicophaeus curvirostris]|uniref:coiled-coil domain-containing protein 142 n=1 Tax=Phaenicophaeus curvirostris TaxID=33595 RepID=UPI0037F0F68C
MEQRGGRWRGPRADEGDGAGLNGLILLLLSARSETAEAGDGAGRSLARSLQKAEAALRSCVRPGLRRLLPPRPQQRDGGDPDGDEEDEDAAEGAGLVPALEQSFPGLQRALCIREDPRTETFHGHVRLQPDADAFLYHAVHPLVARHGATLHALLQHRHLLRLARAYSRRLHASSAFLRRLLVPRAPPSLQGLCRELRAHAGHWAALRRRLRGDPWLRPLLLRRHEAVTGMRRELLLLALHATRLAERHVEERLRALARITSAVPPAPALLADLCQGLELYNKAVAELALELRDAGIADGRGDAGCRPFPVCRVLAVLAAERGRVVAERLWPLLQPQDTGAGTKHECWDDIAVPWRLESGAAEGSGTARHEEAAGITVALQALCREDEELLGLLQRALAGTADGLWHHGACRHTPETAAVETWDVPGAGCHAQATLLARYRPSLWAAAGTVLEQRLAPPHAGAASSAARGLARALAHGEHGERGFGWRRGAAALPRGSE